MAQQTTAGGLPIHGVATLSIGRPERGEGEDSQSSSSNSPTRADYDDTDFFINNNDSQSSIGVPNAEQINNFQRDGHRCVPPIYLLPAEVLISIFSKLGTPADLLKCMLVCKSWARNVVDLLWLRPACSTWIKHSNICSTLNSERPFFAYADFVRRLNLATLAEQVNDGSVTPLSVCTRVERLTLTKCKELTDQGLTSLLRNNKNLLALDISEDTHISDASINVLAERCRHLQGLNISNCLRVSNESLQRVAQSCKRIKRVSSISCIEAMN
jgi:F-box and leucine-rich repeat protein GRR1